MQEHKKKIGEKLSQFFAWFRYRIGEMMLRGFIAILPWLPQRLLASLYRFGAGIAYYILWKYPRRMEENISVVMTQEYPNPKERRALVRRVWNNFARGVHETAVSLHGSPDNLLRNIRVEGEEHLQRAMERNKGVIALSAHLGNFTLIGAYLAAKGYCSNVIIKQPRDVRFSNLMDSYRLRVGIKTISARPRRVAAQRILRALRANEVVLILADELKSTGAEVEFFGHLLPFPRGSVTLAMRAGAPLVPMFMIRDSANELTLRIEPELELQRTGKLQDDVAATMTLFSRQLETIVRRYPDQWNWLGFRKFTKKPSRTAPRRKASPRVSPPNDILTSSGPRPPL
ncbi:MAG TPA: lysophospholipid acyltransferase family protein [Candidatus Binatia bacterium]